MRRSRCWMPVLLLAVSGMGWVQEPSKPSSPPEAPFDRAAVKKFITQHCAKCHNSAAKTAGLDLDAISAKDVDAHPEVWEKVVRKLTARQMPPLSRARPDERTYDAIVAALESELDRIAA